MIVAEEYQKALELIKSKKNILIVTHSSPDGDAIGSSVALLRALKKLELNASFLCLDAIPEKFAFLPGVQDAVKELGSMDLVIRVDCTTAEVDKVSYNLDNKVLSLVISPVSGRFRLEDVHPTYGKPNFDLVIAVDTPELRMLGGFYEQYQDYLGEVSLLNIDHHTSNQKYGTLQIINDQSPSTGEIIYRLLQHSGVEIDADVATALLLAIVTDTGSFQHLSTTAESFAISGELMDKGGRLQEVVENVYRTKSVSTLQLWGRVLSHIHFEKEEGIVWATVSLQDFEETGSLPEQAEVALNDLISNVPEAKIALLLYEYPANLVRGSIRTSPVYNASEIAALFGGGGHKPAAGFRLENTHLEPAIEMVTTKIKHHFALAPKEKPMTPEQIIQKISTMMDTNKTPEPPKTTVAAEARPPVDTRPAATI